jgi:hypothetical protein
MAKPKEESVEIISITTGESAKVQGGASMGTFHVLGLGNNGKVYQWDVSGGTWYLYSQQG